MEPFFQNTHAYIKLFLQHGISSIELNLQRKADDVMKFLRSLQDATRFLNSLCCHSKVLNLSSLFRVFYS